MNNVWAVSNVVIKELYRRKDFYVLFILTGLLTGLLWSLNFFNDDRIVRYLKELCLLMIWISALVIAVVTAARQIPAEREQRTIFPLLAKPITRGEFIVGKFFGCWLATGMALVVFYLFFWIVTATRESNVPIGSYLQAIWLHWWMLGVVVALTLLGSVIFVAPSSTITIILLAVGGILIVGRHLHHAALQLPEPSQTILSVIYFLIPHLEFFDTRDLVVHDWGTISWVVCGLATLYAVAYTTLFLLAAWMIFRRKALN